jgi:putative peptidoglycan lipid II flippase
LLHLPLGLFAIAIATVVLPRLSREAAGGNIEEFSRVHSRAVRLGVFLSFPAAVLMVMLSTELSSAVFEYGRFTQQDSVATGRALAFYSLGLPFFTLVRITVPGFYAHKDTRTPALISVFSVLINIVLCLQLRGPLGFSGLALAAAISGGVNIFLLTYLLRRRVRIIEDKATLLTILKIIVAAGVMAGAVALLRPIVLSIGAGLLPNQLIGLLILLLVAVAVFVVMTLLLRIEELYQVRELVRKKPGR